MGEKSAQPDTLRRRQQIQQDVYRPNLPCVLKRDRVVIEAEATGGRRDATARASRSSSRRFNSASARSRHTTARSHVSRATSRPCFDWAISSRDATIVSAGVTGRSRVDMRLLPLRALVRAGKTAGLPWWRGAQESEDMIRLVVSNPLLSGRVRHSEWSLLRWARLVQGSRVTQCRTIASAPVLTLHPELVDQCSVLFGQSAALRMHQLDSID